MASKILSIMPFLGDTLSMMPTAIYQDPSPLLRAKAAREAGNIAEAAVISEALQAAFPLDPGVLVERLFFALETQQDGLAADMLIQLVGKRATPRDTAIALAATHFYNKAHAPAYLMIGDRPDFFAPRWLNICGRRHPANPTPVTISADFAIPTATNSMEIVYCALALGQIPQPIEDRIISEARRVLHQQGFFLAKLVDNSSQHAELFAKLQQQGIEPLCDQGDVLKRRFAYLAPFAEDAENCQSFILGIPL
jgi:hypothetical protein